MVLAGSERVHHLNYLVSTTYTSRNSRLRYLSSDIAGRGLVQQPNGPLQGRWAEVHVALRRGQVLVTLTHGAGESRHMDFQPCRADRRAR